MRVQLVFCTVMDCDHRPREFLIEMETTLSEDLYCQTLLHELWHVYQHVITHFVIQAWCSLLEEH